MTPDIMKMDPQDLCGWLAQEIDQNWYDNVDLYDPEHGHFNIPACAFAARNHMVKLATDAVNKGISSECFDLEKIVKVIHPYGTPFWSPVEVWLRAAALVLVLAGWGKNENI